MFAKPDSLSCHLRKLMLCFAGGCMREAQAFLETRKPADAIVGQWMLVGEIVLLTGAP